VFQEKRKLAGEEGKTRTNPKKFFTNTKENDFPFFCVPATRRRGGKEREREKKRSRGE